MESRNQQPGSGMSHGNISVALRNVLRSGPLSPEQLADILEEPHTRRAWWLDLHTGCDLLTGTSFDLINQAVDKVQGPITKGNTAPTGSNGQPADAPVFVFGQAASSNELTMPVCECAQPVASLKPFDWQCAKCKGVIPSSNQVSSAPHKHGLGIADHEFDCTCSVCWTHNCGAFSSQQRRDLEAM